MSSLKSPALDPKTVEGRRGTAYPEPLRARVAGREKRALGNALGLENFGVNLVRLEPGAASALRHWHTKQDEFVWVLEGELTLVTDAGPQLLRPACARGFRRARPTGIISSTVRSATRCISKSATAARATPQPIPMTISRPAPAPPGS